MNFICPDSNRDFYEPSSELEFSATVEESNCNYTLTIETSLACPYDCISEDTTDDKGERFTVCGGKGVCATDPNAGFVRCLCDDGWTGVGCSVVDTGSGGSSHTGFKVAIGIITVLVVVLIAVSIYLFMRNRTLVNGPRSGRLLTVTEAPFQTAEPQVPDDLYSSDSQSSEERIVVTQPPKVSTSKKSRQGGGADLEMDVRVTGISALDGSDRSDSDRGTEDRGFLRQD